MVYQWPNVTRPSSRNETNVDQNINYNLAVRNGLCSRIDSFREVRRYRTKSNDLLDFSVSCIRRWHWECLIVMQGKRFRWRKSKSTCVKIVCRSLTSACGRSDRWWWRCADVTDYLALVKLPVQKFLLIIMYAKYSYVVVSSLSSENSTTSLLNPEKNENARRGQTTTIQMKMLCWYQQEKNCEVRKAKNGWAFHLSQQRGGGQEDGTQRTAIQSESRLERAGEGAYETVLCRD